MKCSTSGISQFCGFKSFLRNEPNVLAKIQRKRLAEGEEKAFFTEQMCGSRGFAQRSQTGFCAQLSEKTNPPEHLRRTGVTVLRNEAERADDLVVKRTHWLG